MHYVYMYGTLNIHEVAHKFKSSAIAGGPCYTECCHYCLCVSRLLLENPVIQNVLIIAYASVGYC